MGVIPPFITGSGTHLVEAYLNLQRFMRPQGSFKPGHKTHGMKTDLKPG